MTFEDKTCCPEETDAQEQDNTEAVWLPDTPVGIIGALDEEIALLLKTLELEEKKKVAGITFYFGKIHCHNVIVCKSGIGKVNAAFTAQILIDRFCVGCILFTGTAGAIGRGIRIGDAIISTRVQQYDVDFSAIGFSLGTIPFLKTSVFNADPRLVALAAKSAAANEQRAFKGIILTGDRFVASEKLARFLEERFNGLCVEAEGGAVGQVCYLNKIPFVVIRGISDQADDDAGETFNEFLELAARSAERVVLTMLSHWDKLKCACLE